MLSTVTLLSRVGLAVAEDRLPLDQLSQALLWGAEVVGACLVGAESGGVALLRSSLSEERVASLTLPADLAAEALTPVQGEHGH